MVFYRINRIGFSSLLAAFCYLIAVNPVHGQIKRNEH